MEFAPDGRLFVSLQGGDLRVIENGVLLATPFVTVQTTADGERGLSGIAFDPGFASNQFVYVYYTVISAPIHNRVSRFTANGNVAVAGSETAILDLDNLSAATTHNGGAIHFGPDGKLYVAVGENMNPANSQTVANRLGKMLRINADGTIPSDNPTSFPGIAGSPTGDNRAIWAVGLRNPFTFAVQPGTGRLFINDVGNHSFEEINDGIAGSNYGWNLCEGFCSPPDPNFRDPLLQYSHGISGTSGCAIVGGAFNNPSDQPVSFQLHWQVFLLRPMQRLDSVDGPVGQHGECFRHGHRHAGRPEGRPRGEPLLSRPRERWTGLEDQRDIHRDAHAIANTNRHIWHYLLLLESSPRPGATCDAHPHWCFRGVNIVRRLR